MSAHHRLSNAAFEARRKEEAKAIGAVLLALCAFWVAVAYGIWSLFA